MDRKLVYAGQVPLSGQILQTERNTMVAIAKLSEIVFGTPTVADGLACTASAPASMVINIAPGQIYTLASLDSSAFGSLSSDTTHNVMKQGINIDALALTLVAPVTAGQSVNYLIQGAITETDTDNTTLPYVKSANPAIPFSGANNSGIAQPTTRKVTLQISQKAGTAATTGTQTTPAVDVGFVPLYVITVAQGATQVQQSAISQHPQSPFLFKHLPELPGWVQGGQFHWAQDTGTANALAVALTPIPTAYTAGMILLIKKSAAGNTGNVTINVNGIGVASVLDPTGAQIGSGNMPANSVMLLGCDGTGFRFMNGSITQTTISSITATSGEGITVGGTTPFPVALNFPGLSADSPTALDLFAFYDNEGAHHKNIQWQNLVPLIGAGLVTGLINVQLITASGTYTKTTGARRALVFATGGGGGGGGSGPGGTGGGGGAGGTAIAFSDLTGVSTVTCTIGAGGAGNSGANGASGGATSFGSLAVATGGVGGQGNSSEVPIQRFQT